MNYFLSHLIDTPFARTIVISDSEYKALAQAKAKDQIYRLEARAKNYEDAASELRAEIRDIKEQVGLLPDNNETEQTPETTDES